MTVVLLVGGLTFVVGLLILRPFSASGGRPQVRACAPDDDRRRELLRQLRDLDDDLAAGKLTAGDHARLRDPVEREAAAVLRRKAPGPAGGTAAATSSTPAATSSTVAATSGTAAATSGTVAATSSTRPGSAAPGPPQGRDTGRDAGVGTRRWSRRTVTLLALAGVAAGAGILLAGAVSARHPGQTITGNSVPGAAAPVAGSQGGPGPATRSGHKGPTPQELAAVAAAEARVKQNPKDLSAHLALADAYAAAGAGQLAAVEYLAVIRIDPANPVANTNLALLAFEVGRPAQGKAMVDRVLAANPKYPEALYVRGLIDLMGLRRPKAAERDFGAYLAIAPFGSHRTAAVTLLALAQSQVHP